MSSLKHRSIWQRVGSRIVVAAALAFALAAVHPAMQAQSTDEHWVGTWSTSEVGRPPCRGRRAVEPSPGECPESEAVQLPQAQLWQDPGTSRDRAIGSPTLFGTGRWPRQQIRASRALTPHCRQHQ